MAYVPPTEKLAGQPLGFLTWNRILENARDLVALLRVQHDADGEHNALEIPRGVVTYTHDGVGGYTRDFDVAGKVGTMSLMRLGMGHLQLTWGDSEFYPGPVALSVSVRDGTVDSAPCLATATSVEPHQAEVRLFQAVGGNTWQPTDLSFSLAIHSPPHSQASSWPEVPSVNVGRGYTLGAELWNVLVEALKTSSDLLEIRHSSFGVHEDPTIPQYLVRGVFEAGAYTLTMEGPGSVTASRGGPGIVDIHFSGTNLSFPIHVFTVAEYARHAAGLITDQVIAHSPQPSDTDEMIRLYLWKWDGTSWVLDDSDFLVAIHTNV